MKVIDYKMLTHYKYDDFEEEVKAMLKKGWELYGSPTYGLSGYNGSRYYAQAFVKYEQENRKQQFAISYTREFE